MGKFTLFCILALVVAFVAPAYAEVQNVKVSGDITARYLYRSDYDLTKNDDDFVDGDSNNSDNQSFFMSTVGVNVAADLTDNVSATVRLVNQRDWDRPADGNSYTDVELDLGYVTLKEMLYAPLTLNVGRQDLWFGKGFIVGSALLTGAVDPNGSLAANEFSDLTAFDAIRATLDYNPLTIDLLYSKVDANSAVSFDDTDLYGVNVGYKFNSWNAEAEGYYFNKHDRVGSQASTVTDTNEVHTVGGRGSLMPIDNLNIFGELAYQLGDYSTATGTTRDRSAWAADIGTDYTFKPVMWEPKVGFEWVFYSGEEAGNSGDYEGWDPMYRGKFDTLIREFVRSAFYETTATGDNYSNTNQHQFLISGSIKPLDSLTAKVTWDIIRADEQYVAGRSKDIGDEVDVRLTYDYTKDVQFDLLAGWFIPGKYYQSPDDSTAKAVIGSMKVTF